MPYCQLFYHIVTATKNRQPLITSEVEPAIHQYLRAKSLEMEAIVYALNGTQDHIHLLVSIPPKIAVATFIGQVKAFTSTRFNKTYPQFGPFSWQSAYGVFTLDRKRLPNYVDYVERQKEHHRQGSFIRSLESCEENENKIAEEKQAYEF
jgi:putative transposase